MRRQRCLIAFNLVINRLVLIGDSRAARIFRRYLDRLRVSFHKRRTVRRSRRIAARECVVNATAKQGERTGKHKWHQPRLAPGRFGDRREYIVGNGRALERIIIAVSINMHRGRCTHGHRGSPCCSSGSGRSHLLADQCVEIEVVFIDRSFCWHNRSDLPRLGNLNRFGKLVIRIRLLRHIIQGLEFKIRNLEIIRRLDFIPFGFRCFNQRHRRFDLLVFFVFKLVSVMRLNRLY